jgi:hypothetical protein
LTRIRVFVDRGHGPDLRRFVVAVCRLVSDERHLHVDHVRRRLEGDLQLQAVEQRPELRLGQVLEPLGAMRQPVKPDREVCGCRRVSDAWAASVFARCRRSSRGLTDDGRYRPAFSPAVSSDRAG